jgi:dTDP-4-dehydrorhamnose reductase
MRADFSWRPGRLEKFADAGIDACSCRTITAARAMDLRGLHLQSSTRRASWCASPAAAYSTWWSICAAARRASAPGGAWSCPPRTIACSGCPRDWRTAFWSPRRAPIFSTSAPTSTVPRRADARLERSCARHQVAAARRRAEAVGQGRARQELRRHREVRMRVLVLGGGGQVGRAVAGRCAAARGHRQDARGARYRRCVAVGALLAVAKADWIVNAAAYTAVDLAEDEPAQAAAINDTAVGILAAPPRRPASRLLHLSTDFVFDGASNRAYLPDDADQPLERLRREQAGRREVGRSRRECAASCCAPRGCTRPPGKNFVLTMLKLMREREQVRVVCDQIGAPTWATGIAARSGTCIEAAGARRASITGPISAWRAGTTSRSPFRTRRSRGACSRARCRSCRSRPRISDPRHAPGVQRARYRRDARRCRDARDALAPQP